MARTSWRQMAQQFLVSRAGSDGGSHSRKDESHGSTEEVSRRVAGAAIRMAVELRRDPSTRSGALRRVGEQLGINRETLRSWVTQIEIDAGARTGTTSDEARRVLELEREVRELRRANEIRRTASAFFAAAEFDRQLK